ncbi:MAG: hypothetical protein ACKPEA_09265 [Planctomycetota bacterium]
MMQSTVEEELAKCVAAHTHAQFERHESTHRHELELRAIIVVEQACHRVLSTLAASGVQQAPDAAVATALEWAAARFGRASAQIAGSVWVGEDGVVSVGADAPAWLQEIAHAAKLLDRLPSIVQELEAHPEGEAIRLGLA